MRKGDKNIDELFESARNKPTEFQIEEVEKMVLGFPLMPSTFDWSSIINLNSIIMTSVSAFIIAGSLMLYSSSSQETAQPSPEQHTDNTELLAFNTTAPASLEVEPDLNCAPNNVAPNPTPVQAIEDENPIEPTPQQDNQIDQFVDDIHNTGGPFTPTDLGTEPPVDIEPEEPELPEEPEEMHRHDDANHTHSPAHNDEEGKREFNLSGFDGVDVAGSFDVFVSQSSSFKVWAEGDEKDVQKLELTVRNGELIIKNKKGSGRKGNYSSCNSNGVTVYVEMPSFHQMSVSGSGDLTISSFSSLGGADFAVAGSGSIDVDGELEFSGKVECSIAGSGDMNIDGDAPSVEIDIAGSGAFAGLDLRVKDAEISIAGSGEVGIHAEETMDVSIAGSGDIEYIGNPNITQSIAGSGSIHSH